MSKIAVYPGTFDPLTFGHLDLIKRSLKIVDKLIIGVANNNNKIPLLSIEDRKSIIQNDLKNLSIDYKNVSIEVINGLLTDFAKNYKATCIIITIIIIPITTKVINIFMMMSISVPVVIIIIMLLLTIIMLIIIVMSPAVNAAIMQR